MHRRMERHTRTALHPRTIDWRSGLFYGAHETSVLLQWTGRRSESCGSSSMATACRIVSGRHGPAVRIDSRNLYGNMAICQA